MAGVPSSIFGADLVRHFLESYSGGTWDDDTGTLDATQANATQRPSTTVIGGRTYLTFDGADDVLATGTADLSSGELTIGFLLRSSTTPAGEVYVLAHGYGGFAWGFGAAPGWMDGRLGFTVDTGTWTETDIDVCDGTLRRFVVTVGPANGSRIYVDGVLQAVDQPLVTAIGTASDSVAIGGLAASDGQTVVLNHAFDIANLFFADREATPAEVASLDAYLDAWASPTTQAGRTGARPAPAPPRSPRSVLLRPPRLPETPRASLVSAGARPSRRAPWRPPPSTLQGPPTLPPVTLPPVARLVTLQPPWLRPAVQMRRSGAWLVPVVVPLASIPIVSVRSRVERAAGAESAGEILTAARSRIERETTS